MDPNSNSDRQLINDACEKIFEMFYKAFAPYMGKNEHWSETLDNYIRSEWGKLDDSVADLESPFNMNEESDIIMELYKKIYTTFEISQCDYDKYEDCVDWDGLHELLSYYMCLIEK